MERGPFQVSDDFIIDHMITYDMKRMSVSLFPREGSLVVCNEHEEFAREVGIFHSDGGRRSNVFWNSGEDDPAAYYSNRYSNVTVLVW